VQSADLWNDPRVLFPELPKASGLRSMLAVPLRLGDRAIGALVALRRDVHTFTPAQEELLMALADQAAIALEHARLYRELEARVRERTRQLDEEKRFVEVVVDTLPLGVFVLDAALAVVRANRAGTTVLRDAATGPRAFRALLPEDKADAVEAFLRAAMGEGGVRTMEDEMLAAGRPRVLRLTAAPLAAPGEAPGHVVVLWPPASPTSSTTPSPPSRDARRRCSSARARSRSKASRSSPTSVAISPPSRRRRTGARRSPARCCSSSASRASGDSPPT
jgi:PAS domain-containing protein